MPHYPLKLGGRTSEIGLDVVTHNGGVIVRSVGYGTKGYDTGIIPNTTIRFVGNREVTSVAEFKQVLQKSKGVEVNIQTSESVFPFKRSLFLRCVTLITATGKHQLTAVLTKKNFELYSGVDLPFQIVPLSTIKDVTIVNADGRQIIAITLKTSSANKDPEDILLYQSDDLRNPPGHGDDIPLLILKMKKYKNKAIREKTSIHPSHDTISIATVETGSSAGVSIVSTNDYIESCHLKYLTAKDLSADYEPIKHLISRRGGAVIHYAAICRKFGGTGRRILLISDRAVYIWLSSSKIARCFYLDDVTEVLASPDTFQLGFRLNTEHDLFIKLLDSTTGAACETLQLLLPRLCIRILYNTSPDLVAQKLWLEKPRDWRMTTEKIIPFTYRNDKVPDDDKGRELPGPLSRTVGGYRGRSGSGVVMPDVLFPVVDMQPPPPSPSPPILAPPPPLLAPPPPPAVVPIQQPPVIIQQTSGPVIEAQQHQLDYVTQQLGNIIHDVERIGRLVPVDYDRRMEALERKVNKQSDLESRITALECALEDLLPAEKPHLNAFQQLQQIPLQHVDFQPTTVSQYEVSHLQSPSRPHITQDPSKSPPRIHGTVDVGDSKVLYMRVAPARRSSLVGHRRL